LFHLTVDGIQLGYVKIHDALIEFSGLNNGSIIRDPLQDSRIQTIGLLVSSESLIIFFHPKISSPHIVVGSGRLRLEFQRLLVALNRFPVLLETVMDRT